MTTPLLNADLCENEPDDLTKALFPLLDIANLACGRHAGSERKARLGLQLAIAHRTEVSAHPGLPGKHGRGNQVPSLAELEVELRAQLAWLHHLAVAECAVITYLKPHGTLYHLAESDPEVRKVLLTLADDFRLAPICLAGGKVVRSAEKRGLQTLEEAFLDRNYRSSTALVPRSHPRALLTGPGEIVARLQNYQSKGELETIDHYPFSLRADTFCLHSDTPNSLLILRAARRAILSF